MSTEGTPLTDHARIEERAGRWLARRDSGRWSAEDECDFQSWLGESMAHGVAYWRLQDAWESALRLRALGAGVHSEEPPPPGQWNFSPFFSRRPHTPDRLQDSAFLRRRTWAACAGLTFAAVAAGYLWTSAGSFSTPLGATASLPIEDGSKVTLNTDSAVKVVISDSERRIELKQGEAFFEVARDPLRPFVVKVGNKRVTALGTSFSVRKVAARGADDIQIVVTDGTVGVESINGGSMRMLAATPLTAGDIASTVGDRLVVQHSEPRAAREQLSWRSGLLVFRNATLAQAADEFNRYNKRKITIDDPHAAALTIAGSFRTTNVDSFVEIIQKGYPVRIESTGDGFTVLAEH